MNAGEGISPFLLVLALQWFTAHLPIDEQRPWPRTLTANGSRVTLYLPQVEEWTSNWFRARAVIEVKPPRAKKESLGVVWIEAHGTVDHERRWVTFDRMEITRGLFPDAKDNGSNLVGIAKQVVPLGTRSVSLDYLITALGFVQTQGRRNPAELKHDPPEIIWVTNRAELVLIDGAPVLRPVPGMNCDRVMNTPALLLHDSSAGKFYFGEDGRWFSADSLEGAWSRAQDPPAQFAALNPAPTNQEAAQEEAYPVSILVRTNPAELLVTDGLPDFKPIRGTVLQYAADSDSQLYFHSTEGAAYLLLSGRWFKSKSLRGPWSYVPPGELPADFAKIPPDSPQAVVLASVPGTRQAQLSLVANSIPTTATVSRKLAKLEFAYDGEPQFKNIKGTSLSYAVNAPLPVIDTGHGFFAIQDGVWFTAGAPGGPWQVAAEVPGEIYKIPPDSPVYYTTFARVYAADDDTVDVGYTAGYTGGYEDNGTVVYGTGWDYQPWCGTNYYGWGWTWGYSYLYVPWYYSWDWRPWWRPWRPWTEWQPWTPWSNQSSGLWAASIENIYNRWRSGAGVTPYTASGKPAPATGQPSSGYPALYGRFRGSPRPATLTPPANTLAVNPYYRPPPSTRAGEIPRGAELLTTVRQSPGGGRDYYASPDGNIYQRRKDGWYARQPDGGWAFFGFSDTPATRPSTGPTQPDYSDRATLGPRLSPTGRARETESSNAATRRQTQATTALESQYYSRMAAEVQMRNPAPQTGGRRATRPAARRR